jgi:hypothetical protein
VDIELVTGEIGTGKTAVTVAGRMLELLERAPGTLFYNVAINFEGVRELLKRSGRPASDLDRIFVIPETVHQSWRRGDDTPQKYFSRLSQEQPDRFPHGALHNAAVVLDEVQKYWPSDSGAIGGGSSNAGRVARNEGQEFLSTIRQAGCVVIVLITQRRALLSRAVLSLVTRIHELTNAAKFRPWGLDIHACRQLVAKLTGQYNQLVTERVLIRAGEGEQWEKIESRVHYLRSWMFTVYDSFSAHEIGGVRSPVPRPLLPFERYSWGRFLCWFVARNVVFLGVVGAAVLFVLWLWSGGLSGALAAARQRVTDSFNGLGVASTGEPAKAAEPVQLDLQAVGDSVPKDENEIRALIAQNRVLVSELRSLRAVRPEPLFLNGVVGSTAIFDGIPYNVGSMLPDGRIIATIDNTRGRVECRDGYAYSVSSASARSSLGSVSDAANNGPGRESGSRAKR